MNPFTTPINAVQVLERAINSAETSLSSDRYCIAENLSRNEDMQKDVEEKEALLKDLRHALSLIVPS